MGAVLRCFYLFVRISLGMESGAEANLGARDVEERRRDRRVQACAYVLGQVPRWRVGVPGQTKELRDEVLCLEDFYIAC